MELVENKNDKQRKQSSERMKLNNPMKNKETVIKNVKTKLENGTSGLGRPMPVYLRIRHSERMKINNPMKNPETVKKNFISHKRCKSGPEKFLEKVFKKEKINNVKYVGDGKIFINGRCPDFIVENVNKIIEIYDSSFIYSGVVRDSEWINNRKKIFDKYEVLFIDFHVFGKAGMYSELVNILKDFIK